MAIYVTCDWCQGEGEEEGLWPTRCPHCKGRGVLDIEDDAPDEDWEEEETAMQTGG